MNVQLTQTAGVELCGYAEPSGVVVDVEVSAESVVVLARGYPERQHEATTNK